MNFFCILYSYSLTNDYIILHNEGLVVSTCLGGAFVGSTVSGWIADGIGRRRSFQMCAIPMIIGASVR